MSKDEFKTSTANFYSYDNIKLKLYCDIATSGNYKLIAITPGQDPEKCYQAWEEIIKRNSELSGGVEYFATFNLAQSYALLVNDYNLIKSCLLKLFFMVDDKTIEFLESMGYRIDTSGSKAYKNSLDAAMRKSDNLITKYTMKRKELNKISEDAEKQTPVGFEELVANISAAIGFSIDDNITLARFNEYKKIIKKKQLKQPENAI